LNQQLSAFYFIGNVSLLLAKLKEKKVGRGRGEAVRRSRRRLYAREMLTFALETVTGLDLIKDISFFSTSLCMCVCVSVCMATNRS
jgi:hypothetical protein